MNYQVPEAYAPLWWNANTNIREIDRRDDRKFVRSSDFERPGSVFVSLKDELKIIPELRFQSLHFLKYLEGVSPLTEYQYRKDEITACPFYPTLLKEDFSHETMPCGVFHDPLMYRIMCSYYVTSGLSVNKCATKAFEMDLQKATSSILRSGVAENPSKTLQHYFAGVQSLIPGGAYPNFKKLFNIPDVDVCKNCYYKTRDCKLPVPCFYRKMMNRGSRLALNPVTQMQSILAANPEYLGNGLLSRVNRPGNDSGDLLVWACPRHPLDHRELRIRLFFHSENFDVQSVVLGSSIGHYAYSVTAKKDPGDEDRVNVLLRHGNEGRKEARLLRVNVEEKPVVESCETICCPFSVISEAGSPFSAHHFVVCGRSDGDARLCLWDAHAERALWSGQLALNCAGEDCVSEAGQFAEYFTPRGNVELRTRDHHRPKTSNYHTKIIRDAYRKRRKLDQETLSQLPVFQYEAPGTSNVAELYRMCLPYDLQAQFMFENDSTILRENHNPQLLQKLEQELAFSHGGYYLGCGWGPIAPVVTLATPKRFLLADTRINGRSSDCINTIIDLNSFRDKLVDSTLPTQ